MDLMIKNKTIYYLKKILKMLHFHNNTNKKDIFIFSSFRSGSTWLAEIIKNHPKVKFPISPNKIEFLKNIDDYYKNISPRPYYINLTDKEKTVLKKYVTKTVNDKLIYSRRYINIFNKKNHNFITNRSVFRLLRSNYLINWFTNEFDIHAIYLLRHPIAASLSRQKIWKNSSNPSYWSPNNSYFLNNEFFIKNHLNKNLQLYLKKNLNKFSLLEKFVISWCLENLELIRKVQNSKKNNFIFLTYEELLMNSSRVISFLSEKLNLNDKEALLQQLKKPSSTVKYSDEKTKNNLNNNTYNKEYLLKKWKNTISNKTEKKLFDIIDLFDIDIYEMNNFMPKNKFLIED
ncbi:MAG: sulfotransferase domain-containing protein [Bacillota bacterium]